MVVLRSPVFANPSADPSPGACLLEGLSRSPSDGRSECGSRLETELCQSCRSGCRENTGLMQPRREKRPESVYDKEFLFRRIMIARGRPNEITVDAVLASEKKL